MLQPEFLLIDKPAGCTSFDVIRDLRRTLGIKRMGHLGTLDPFATGLLVLALGTATRLLTPLHALSKTYVAKARLGATSTTDDCDGVVTETGGVIPARRAVDEALAQFVGTIQQVPPAFAAVKVAGERAYDKARRGEDVTLAARTVTVHRITPISFDPPELIFEVECSTGTYIRAIARDLGQQLGCGAYLTALRRTRVGSLCVDDAGTPADPLRGVRPSRAVLSSVLPIIDCTEAARTALGYGRAFPALGAADGPVAIADGDVVIALGDARGGAIAPTTVRPDTLAASAEST